jgi:hypothetical protein
VYKPATNFYNGQDLSDLVSEKEKNQPQYLIAKADDLIARLVTGRPELRRARNLFESRRDPRRMEHLTDNYGIGNPGKVPFINLFRNRVLVLIGKFLEAEIPSQIACTDSVSIGTLEQERFEYGMKELVSRLLSGVQERVQQAQQGQQPDTPELLKQNRLKELADSLEEFQSSIEIQAGHVLNELLLDQELGLKTKLAKHLENLLVEGATYFTTEEGEPGLWGDHKVISAGNIFSDAPPTDTTTENVTAYVQRELLNKQAVLTRCT